MPGLVVTKSNDELASEANEAQQLEQRAREYYEDEYESQLVAHIKQAWSRNQDAKRDIERELLRCLRQRRGEYDPDEKDLIRQTGGENAIYMMLTATKCRAAASWIQDVMMPADDLPWGLEPTPMPDLPREVEQELVKRVFAMKQEQAQAQGQSVQKHEVLDTINDLSDRILSDVNDRAKESADRMTRHVNDDLEEGGFRRALEQFIEDFVTYPAAFLKGPIYRQRKRVEWGPGWQPQPVSQTRMEYERVSPFDIYPSADAETVEDGDLIERVRFTRRQISQMRGQKGYKDDAIERVLRDYRTGRLHHWLWVDSQREQLENKDDTWWLSPPHIIDGLHYWGSVSGLALLEWGMDPDTIDPLEEYDIEAILIGSEVIRCTINDDPLSRRPYQSASYQTIPGSIWGDALPYLMRDTQSMCNSVARSLGDNLAISSGPQVIVNTSLLAEGEDITNIYPWKIHQVSYDPSTASAAQRPIDFFQPSANANELMAVYAEFEQRADDETMIPRYTYGGGSSESQGAGSTASGLSMLFDATSKGIRKAIGHIDQGCMRPVVEKTWMEEMRYGDDWQAKGDAQVVPRGATAMLVADQAQARRQEFLQMTANEIDMQIVGYGGRAAVLRDVVDKSLDINVDDVVPKPEEVERRMQNQRSQPDPEVVNDRKKLELEANKTAEEADRKRRELALQADEQSHEQRMAEANLKLDMARYLGEQEQRLMERGLPTENSDKQAQNSEAR